MIIPLRNSFHAYVKEMKNLLVVPIVSTTDSIVVTPPGEVLKFLLPGLCHLTAEDKARRVLLENNVHVTLGRYFHYRWQLFTSGETLAQESEVGKRYNHMYQISPFR